MMTKLDALVDDYKSRGRRLKSLDVQSLEQRWFAAFQRANCTFGQRQVDALREADDMEAELLLRGLTPPPPRMS